jgi:hypothetical protein
MGWLLAGFVEVRVFAYPDVARCFDDESRATSLERADRDGDVFANADTLSG